MKKSRLEKAKQVIGYIKITFRPLANGWYRCVQTGERLRRAALEAYRLQHGNKAHQGTARALIVVTNHSFHCTSCGREHYHEGRNLTCQCGKRYRLQHKKEKPKQSFWGW